jgi:hypothetical protein
LYSSSIFSAQTERTSEEKLWISIKHNLVKDVGKKDKIVIPLPIKQDGSEREHDTKVLLKLPHS